MTNLTLSYLLAEPADAVHTRERTALDTLLAAQQGRVVLFGVGSVGTRALQELRKTGVEPLCLSDNDAARWGTEVDGSVVLAPAEAAARYGADSLFLVTIWNAAHWFVETLAQLQALGCRAVSCYSPLFWRFPERFLPCLLNDLPHKLLQAASDVLQAESLWADEPSLNTYTALVRWYFTGDGSVLPPRPKENTYFPSDLFTVTADEVLVDCGAFDGDTIRQMLQRAGSLFNAIHAVEADPLNLGKLDGNLRGLDAETGLKIVVHRCAVGAQRSKVRFEITGSVDSKMCDSGGVEVDCVPIDELFTATRVTMIKMDIEGAEYEALIGASATLKRDGPILAVCVYHLQRDLWRLPLLVREMLPQHKLFLRAYEGDGFQTVLYAVPPERCMATPTP